MILLNAILGLFAIFFVPQILIHCKMTKLDHSLRILLGLIISLTATWIVALISYYFHLSDISIRYLVYILIAYSAYFFVRNNCIRDLSIDKISDWLLAALILLPLFAKIGIGFTALDAAASWNRWAMELYHYTYHPINAAYPILLPAIWSIVYKIQGTEEIWWTAQITLFLLPFFITVLLLQRYKTSKNLTYILILLFAYPYFLSSPTIDGNMDMPVMYMGLLSLISIHTAEQKKGTEDFLYYTYAALALAGLASITKQAGLSYLLFVVLYILLNWKEFKNKKKIVVAIVFSTLYFLSFLALYHHNSHASAIDNINHLEHLSNKFGAWEAFVRRPLVMFPRFYMQPEHIGIFVPLLDKLHIQYVSFIFVMIGYLSILFFKDLRKLDSVSLWSAIFFTLGVLIWVKYFSYDFRNSLWTRSYCIVFMAIGLDRFLKFFKIDGKKILKLLIVLLATATVLYIVNVGDRVAKEIQKEGQIKVSQKPELAKFAAKLLKNKKQCCKIYTNELALPYNYYVKKYQKRGQFVPMGRDYHFQDFSYLEHNCSDGSYMIIRSTSMYMDEWWKIQKLLDEKLIKEVKPFVYYVPPGFKVNKDFFSRIGKIEKIRLPSKTTDDVKYAIDHIEKENGFVIVKGWSYIPEKRSNFVKKFIVLLNGKRNYVISTINQRRVDVAKFFKNDKYEYAGFYTEIDLKTIAPGNYRIGLLLIDKKGNKHYTVSNLYVEIP